MEHFEYMKHQSPCLQAGASQWFEGAFWDSAHASASDEQLALLRASPSPVTLHQSIHDDLIVLSCRIEKFRPRRNRERIAQWL